MSLFVFFLLLLLYYQNTGGGAGRVLHQIRVDQDFSRTQSIFPVRPLRAGAPPKEMCGDARYLGPVLVTNRD